MDPLVIEDDGVGAVIAVYSDTVHSLSLAFGSGFTVAVVVVEEPNQEKFKPSRGIWFDTVNTFIRGGQFTPETTRDLVVHHR